MMELAIRDIKTAITTMVKYLKKNINLTSREMEDLKKNQGDF